MLMQSGADLVHKSGQVLFEVCLRKASSAELVLDRLGAFVNTAWFCAGEAGVSGAARLSPCRVMDNSCTARLVVWVYAGCPVVT